MSEPAGKKVVMMTIADDFAGQRLDNFLLRTLKGVPKSKIYKIVRKGEVRVNKGRVAVNYRLNSGDIVRIPPVRQSQPDQNQPHNGLKQSLKDAILFENKEIIVVNKPSGMAVHGGSGISFGVIETLRAMRPEEKGLELVHRLDRETSGCLLITKKRSALKKLHDLIREDGIEKKYHALVLGNWGKKTSLKVDAPLRKNTLKGGERVVRVDPDGKPSLTYFSVLEKFQDYMLVEALLKTGRTHQIRVHLQHVGTPILGDPKYGDEQANRQIKTLGLYRLFLHAASLAYTDPESGKLMLFKAPMDEELEQVLSVLRQ
jgi:23S rRNA pseudouridine955/2504/2580 synthase